jgi:two-component system, NtrC family, sensor kinase
MFRKSTHFQTLSTRLMLFVVAPLVIVVGLTALAVIGTLERQFEQRMQEDVELVARALQRPVSHALERQRQGSLHSALESALDIGRVYGAYLYDDDGVLLASLGTVEQQHQPDNSVALRHQPRGGGQYGRIQGESVYSYYVPVRLGEERGTGLLRITRRKADIDVFMSQLRIGGAALVLFLTILLASIVILGYRRTAGNAFLELQKSMSRIRAGDRKHRSEIRGPYELSVISKELNAMLDSIHHAEEQIERSREEKMELLKRLAASEKLASIGQLAAGIAHELGTPLGTVAGRVTRLTRRDDLPSPASRELGDIALEVRRIERIVQEVLDFARRKRLQYRRISAGELLLVSRSAFIAEEGASHGTRLELVAKENDVFLEVDPSRVEQALGNLVRNATQFASGGNICLSWYNIEDCICFVVEDDGPGVPQKSWRRIFDPFFTTRGEYGTGFGLAIVEAIANEHGGEVRVGKSQLGGAKFELILPVTPPQTPVDQA